MQSSYKKILLLLTVLAVIVFAVVFGKHVRNAGQDAQQPGKKVPLVVYSNSYFMSSYGPGPQIKEEFEKFCYCEVEYVDAGTSVMAIERMKLDPKRRVDVLVGLDHLMVHRAANTVRFQDISRPEAQWDKSMQKFIYARFVPYDWAPMGFLYRKGDAPAEFVNSKTLEAAIQNLKDKSVNLTDPTLSPVGLELLYWLFTHYGEAGLPAALANLKPKVHSYSPSWSSAYGLFQKKQGWAIFTYLTSLVYHWKEEKDESFDFLRLDEALPAQIEYSAVPESCWNCADAKKFVHFLVTPAVQKILVDKNYMFPMIQGVDLSEFHKRLPQVGILGTEKLEDYAKSEQNLLEIWKKNH